MSLPGTTVIQPANTLGSAPVAAPVAAPVPAPAPTVNITQSLPTQAPTSYQPYSQQPHYPPYPYQQQAKQDESGGSSVFTIILVIVIILVIIGIIILFLVFRREKQTTGSTCSTSSDCTDNLVCQNGTCRAQTGGFCTNNNECLSGDGCVDGRCKTVTDVNLGDACNTTDKPCKAGLTCENSICKSSLGSACTTGMSDCVSTASGCVGGICVSASTGAFTGPCRQTSPGSAVTACNSGLVCDTTANRCLLGPGSGCEVDDDCATGAAGPSVCSNNICTTLLINGAIPFAFGGTTTT